MRILVVEDEERIADVIRRGLERAGMEVVHAADGEAGLTAALAGDVDLVVLDLMLPRLPGEVVLARIRAEAPRLPVVILSAKGEVTDRVRALEGGAEDYVTKPFSVRELVARVQVRLRGRDEPLPTGLEVGRVRLDTRTRQAVLDGRAVELTSREYFLLEHLMRHDGQVVGHAQLMAEVWGYDFDPGSNVVEVYVSYLRKKLTPDVIATVRGIGYRFVG